VLTKLLLVITALQEHGAAAAQDHGAGGGPQSPFEVNFGLFFWTWVVFILLFFTLRKFAWPPLLKSVEEREKRIAKQLADAEAANLAAQKLLEEHRAALAQARSESQELIAKAKTVAQKEREVLIAKAHEEQEQMLERARREIVAERDKAVASLRREAVELSLAAAQKLIEANLDSDANRRIVTDYLAGLERQS
jgi:F-type H+-transporting ATPase subunit b